MGLKNVISPHQEMLAYETIWAMEQAGSDVKERDIKKLFQKHTPVESLQKIEQQTKLFSESDIKHRVEKYLDKSLKDEYKTFSIIVNVNFQYPKHLHTSSLPLGLFYYKGELGILERPKIISVVGSRRPTQAGIKITKKLVKNLCKENFVIVSGLAQGVDTVVHQSAIEAGGQTIAVIGTPINLYYPKSNQKLQDEIAQKHLLISHVPFYKYSQENFKIRRFHFPRRNITMGAIAQATVIIEASDTSGTHIQARECLKQGKTLFIHKLCFNNPKISWPHQYQRKGAIKITELKDILDRL